MKKILRGGQQAQDKQELRRLDSTNNPDAQELRRIDNGNEWNNVAEVPFNNAEQQRNERQQRKILAAFSTCENGGHFDKTVINQPDVKMTEDIYNDAMTLFANDKIPQTEIKDFLYSVSGPMQEPDFSNHLIDKLIF